MIQVKLNNIEWEDEDTNKELPWELDYHIDIEESDDLLPVMLAVVSKAYEEHGHIIKDADSTYQVLEDDIPPMFEDNENVDELLAGLDID
jgi:hypothetical protein